MSFGSPEISGAITPERFRISTRALSHSIDLVEMRLFHKYLRLTRSTLGERTTLIRKSSQNTSPTVTQTHKSSIILETKLQKRFPS